MSFAYDGYTARKGDTVSTASAVRGVRSLPSPGVRALQLGIGDRDLEEVIGDVVLGVHVRSLTGVHSGVNSISGDFSVGMEGNMIRDGAIAEPIREATLGGTIQRMLHLSLRSQPIGNGWRPASVRQRWRSMMSH